jgi:hypothetical protein
MAKPRGATSYRLTDEAQALLGRLADVLGLPSKTAVLEYLIRRAAKQELPSAEHPKTERAPQPKRGRPPRKGAAS